MKLKKQIKFVRKIVKNLEQSEIYENILKSLEELQNLKKKEKIITKYIEKDIENDKYCEDFFKNETPHESKFYTDLKIPYPEEFEIICEYCEEKFIPENGEVICKECKDFLENEANLESEYASRLNELYTYTEDGFCDGFTKQ